MKDRIYHDVPYINIMMVGDTGSGKSSVLNTFATAVTNSDRVKKIHRVFPYMTKNANHKV